MPILQTYRALEQIAQRDFSNIIVQAAILTLPTGVALKLRLNLVDGSIVDVFLSMSGRYSYHWDRRAIDKDEIYRHDNAPHRRWRHIATFPKHFHDGHANIVIASYLSDDPETAIREFLLFIQDKLLASEP